MGEASMYDCIFLILLFYMYICILYVDILSNKSIYLSIYWTYSKTTSYCNSNTDWTHLSL